MRRPQTFRRRLIAALAATHLGSAAATAAFAQPQPGEFVARFLGVLSDIPGIDYDAIAITPQNGISAENLRISSAFLHEDLAGRRQEFAERILLDIARPPQDDATEDDLAPEDATILTAAHVALDEAAVAIAITAAIKGGVAWPSPMRAGRRIEAEIGDFQLQLAALAAGLQASETDWPLAYGPDILRGSARLELVAEGSGFPSTSIRLRAQGTLARGGSLELDIDIPHANTEEASGTIVITDLADRQVTALVALFGQLKLARVGSAFDTVATWQEGRQREMPPNVQAFGDEIATMLAHFPQDGDQAAARIADWAATMQAELPAHAATLEALRQFAETPGTLTIHMDPPAVKPDLPDDAILGLHVLGGLLEDSVVLGHLIAYYGITASFTAAAE